MHINLYISMGSLDCWGIPLANISGLPVGILSGLDSAVAGLAMGTDQC